MRLYIPLLGNKAVMRSAMHRMVEAGMETATVGNQGTNEASRGLYRAAGFKPWHLVDDYVKAV